MDLSEMRFKITECKDFNNATAVQNAHFELDKLNSKIKKLEKFKEDLIDLYVTDKPIKDLLKLFFNSKSDTCNLKATERKEMEIKFAKFVEDISWQIHKT